MRISDWSSDVCSSDLPDPERPQRTGKRGGNPGGARYGDGIESAASVQLGIILRRPRGFRHPYRSGTPGPGQPASAGDRTSVVSGKSVSVRVVLGGRSILNKTKALNHRS